MSMKTMSVAGCIALAALWGTCAGMALAQTTKSVEVRAFEILSVDGNRMVVRDATGTQEYSVPDDFRFTVDGKPMSVRELKAGMKGTATVTTTVTSKPVVVTEVREGQVLRASDLSITVREGDKVNRYTQGQFDARGVQIFKDGKPIRMADLRKGDNLSALIVTEKAPVTLTQQEVQATLDEDKAATPAPAAAAPMQMAAADTKAPAPAAPAPAAIPAPAPAQSSGIGVAGWLVVAVLVAIVLFFVLRKRRAS